MTKRFLAGVVLFGVLLAVGALEAHHSLAGVYDLKKVERATGVVEMFKFTNPHGALVIAIKNAQGEARVWSLTTGSANVLVNAGLSATGPDWIKSGDEITVTFNPAKSKPNGICVDVLFPDGRKLHSSQGCVGGDLKSFDELRQLDK